MGMYTELVLGLEIESDPNVIGILQYMLGEIESFDGDYSHEFFETSRWRYMLTCDSYYFDGQTDSKLICDTATGHTYHYLNVRCSFKNYSNEVELFLDWLAPYIRTEGFLGYDRYEEWDDPELIYKVKGKIVYV